MEHQGSLYKKKWQFSNKISIWSRRWKMQVFLGRKIIRCEGLREEDRQTPKPQGISPHFFPPLVTLYHLITLHSSEFMHWHFQPRILSSKVGFSHFYSHSSHNSCHNQYFVVHMHSSNWLNATNVHKCIPVTSQLSLWNMYKVWDQPFPSLKYLTGKGKPDVYKLSSNCRARLAVPFTLALLKPLFH